MNILEEVLLSCEFEDEFFCGYMNSSFIFWIWVDYFDISYRLVVLNKIGINSNSNRSVNFVE